MGFVCLCVCVVGRAHHAVEDRLPPVGLALLDGSQKQRAILGVDHLHVHEPLVARLIKGDKGEEDFGLGRIQAINVDFD